MIEACEEGAGFTQIMYKSFTSYAQIRVKIDYLLDVNLIELKGKKYFATDKGKKALRVIRQLEELFV